MARGSRFDASRCRRLPRPRRRGNQLGVEPRRAGGARVADHIEARGAPLRSAVAARLLSLRNRERPRQRGERCAASSRRGIATVPSVLLGPGELASIAQRNEHAHDLPCFVAAPTVKIVPFGTAGGPIDAIARIYGKKLQQRWGQPVIVEAKPGDAGNWLDEPPRAV